MRATKTNNELTKDQHELVLEHLYLVRAIAQEVRYSLPQSVDVEDLVQAGSLGLIQAARRFEPERGFVFSTFARHRIKGSILDGLRDLDWASRDDRKKMKKIDAALWELERDLNRAPTTEEIAARLGVSALALWRVLCRVPIELSCPTFPEHIENDNPLDIPDPRDWPEKLCARSEMQGQIAAAVASLPPRYREMIRLYYFEDLSMLECGKRMGVAESRISQMHSVAMKRLLGVLRERGIEPGRRAA